MDAKQMHLHPQLRRPPGPVEQEALLDPLIEIDAESSDVSENLAARFLEANEQASLPSTTRGLGKVSRQGGLAAPCRAAYQNSASSIVALPLQHLVQIGDAGRDTLGGYLVLQSERRDRQDRYSMFIDQERIFVCAVTGAPVFDNSHPARGSLLADAMVEQNDAVGNILFQTVPGESAVSFLGRHYGG